MNVEGVRLRVEGRVQGVGFRWFVREVARRQGLAGTVRNLDDGSVEVVASGTADGLLALERAAHEGPPGARVARVHVERCSLDARPPFPFAVVRG